MTLGPYGDALPDNEADDSLEETTFLSLKIAIDKSSEKRNLVNHGVDPADEAPNQKGSGKQSTYR